MNKEPKQVNYTNRFKGAFEAIIKLTEKEEIRGSQLKAINRIAKAQLKNFENKFKAEL